MYTQLSALCICVYVCLCVYLYTYNIFIYMYIQNQHECKTPKVIFLGLLLETDSSSSRLPRSIVNFVSCSYVRRYPREIECYAIDFAFYAFFVSFCRKILISLDMFVDHVIYMAYLAFFLF